MRKWLWAVTLSAFLGGCGMGMEAQLERFDTTARAYEHAIRWSDFSTAYSIAYDMRTAPMPSLGALKDIQITSYETKASSADDTATHMTQLVEIRYVHTSRMAERVLVDKQTWEYSEPEKRWYLRSPFPQFQ
jgi:hypothetical protein